MTLHPKLRRAIGKQKLFDIGIVELELSVEFNNFMSRACLPDDHFNDAQFVGSTAFGVVVPNNDKFKSIHFRKYAEMRIRNQDICEIYWRKYLKNLTSVKYFCADGKEEHTTTCFGPLYMKNNSKSHFIGSSSLVYTINGSCSTVTPNLYDIAQHSKYIRYEITH